MHFLELILVILLTPFWIPALLLLVGFCILLFCAVLVILVVLLFLILCLVIGTLKILYNVHTGLVSARQMVIKDIGDNISWIRLGRLIFKKYFNQIKEDRQIQKKDAQEEIIDE